MKKMSQFEYVVIGTILFVVVGTSFAAYRAIETGQYASSIVACTADAKICPDGTAVGRIGSTCDFADCPAVGGASTSTGSVSTSTKPSGTGTGGIAPFQSGIRGTVLLGPTCPVEQNPPDPACADKPYATTISVSHAGSPSVFATAKSGVNGTYELSLPPGDYTVSAKGGETLPRCASMDVTVNAKGYTTANISCDTGIR